MSPTFGRSMLREWLLDPQFTYLNHGTVGATPIRVLKKQQALRDEIERLPARFMLRELNGEQPAPWRRESRLREAAATVASFLGARPDDLVFVTNVTTGTNAVLRSVALEPGDEIVTTDLAYGAVALTAAAVARSTGAVVRMVEVPFPPRNARQVVDAIIAAITPRTKIAVVDHVTANTALVLPVAQVAEECRRRGVPVLVDGAHAPGALAVDIPSLGVDWYAANLHKWAHAPRSCGILWAAPHRQAALHHPVVSWGYGRGFHAEFEHQATMDPTNFLSAPEGVAILREWDFERVVAYMHGLAWTAGEILSKQWGTEFDHPRDMVGAMVSIQLPVTAGTTAEDAARLRLALLVEDNIEIHLTNWRDRLWARVSAQVYNDEEDVVRLGDAVCRRVGVSGSLAG